MSKGKIGFVGLGTMGFPICYGLYKSGYTMILPVYRRDVDVAAGFIPLAPDQASKEKLYDEMLANGCIGAATPEDLYGNADYIMTSLPNSRIVELTVLGEHGLLENAKPGTVYIDLSSADAASTVKLAKMLEEKGVEMLDAPISGGQEGATKQTLTVMVGGKKEVFEKCRPILDTIGNPEKVTWIGPSGAGDTIKCANNFLSATCLLASAEALAVTTKAGIDPRTAAQVISTSGGSSNAVTYKFPNLIFPGNGLNFAVDLMLKDVGLFTAQAKDMKIPSFFGNTTYQMIDIQSALGNGGKDLMNVVKMMQEWAGVRICDIDGRDA